MKEWIHYVTAFKAVFFPSILPWLPSSHSQKTNIFYSRGVTIVGGTPITDQKLT